MNYPTIQQVEEANIFRLCEWSRFLDSPGMCAIGRDDFESVLQFQLVILNRIIERRGELGGFTPGISKQLGWSSR